MRASVLCVRGAQCNPLSGLHAQFGRGPIAGSGRVKRPRMPGSARERKAAVGRLAVVVLGAKLGLSDQQQQQIRLS